MAIFDEEDKIALNELHSISRLDTKVVVEVIRALIQSAIKSTYAGTNEFTIPGIAKIKFEYHDKVEGTRGVRTEVILEAIPKKALISEINLISEGSETSDLRQIKEEIRDSFRMTVGVDG